MTSVKRLVAPAVSVLILAAIFTQIEPGRLGSYFAGMDWRWFGASMLAFVPDFLIRTFRVRYMMGEELRYSDAFGTILASSSLSVVLPSKGGELAKGFFLSRHVSADLKTCFAAVIFERVMDVAALVLIMFAGLALIGDDRYVLAGVWLGGLVILGCAAVYLAVHLKGAAAEWVRRGVGWIPKVADFLDASRSYVLDLAGSGKILPLAGCSLALWLVHVLQFSCFFEALGYPGPGVTILAYVPAAIFIGLLPVTIAGVGTRELALIFLFAPWAPAELAVGVGLLSHLRYLLPGIAGIGVTHRYLKELT